MAGFGEGLSGQSFTLGMQNTGNTVSTFEAIGQSSSTTDNFIDGDEVANQTTVNDFVVRKTKPTFAKASGLSTTLINGENRLYGFTVTADSAGSVSFGRLSFAVSNSTSGTLAQAKFYRGSTLLDQDDRVELYAGGLDISTETPGTTIATTVTDDVVVAFLIEESVAAGSSQTYYLDMLVDSAGSNETVSTKLSIEDESAPVTGKTTATTPNTALLYSATPASGLFDATSEFFTQDSTTAALGYGVAHLWSDKSADAHAYPTVTVADPSTLTTDTGSYDWTNGYLLKLTELVSHSLSFN
jgi:hypothetical protein